MNFAKKYEMIGGEQVRPFNLSRDFSIKITPIFHYHFH